MKEEPPSTIPNWEWNNDGAAEGRGAMILSRDLARTDLNGISLRVMDNRGIIFFISSQELLQAYYYKLLLRVTFSNTFDNL